MLSIRSLPPVHGKDTTGVPHWVARQLSDVAEVEVRVVSGQLTQPAHQLVRLVQVVVKSHHPVSSVQRPHQTEVLRDAIKIFLEFMFVRRCISIERVDSNLLV